MNEMTVEWIKELSRDETNLYVQLNNPLTLDVQIFERMANDTFCVSGLLRNREKGIVMYSIKGYVSLSDFLKQYVFEKEEIYIFLEHLFEQAIASNRNKPILLHPDYIFLNEYGDTFYFIAIPVTLSEWMFQKDRLKEWIQYIYKNIQTKTAFECIGYLVCFCDTDEFSLPNLILGIQNLRKMYYSSHLFFIHKKPKSTFRVKEPIFSLYRESSKSMEVDAFQTTVLQTVEKIACLENDDSRFEIIGDSVQIGRSNKNEIVLMRKEISQEHAVITKNQNRYYIQDLKSRNGTFINNKKVQRKMRIKEGMIIRFANIEFTFHE